MAYTVKQVAAISGVSVRPLRFYDETGLLKPACYGSNGYRFYEEPQLLMLQQILFYRELGFELKQLKAIVGRSYFKIAAAVQSHRQVLQTYLTRTRSLIATIDKTLEHLKETRKMEKEDRFAGFIVAARDDRFGENIKLGGEPNDCKISAQDTTGAMGIFEFTGKSGGPRHLHSDQDEWIYIINGEFEFHLDDQPYRLSAGECVFIPRQTAHVWACVSDQPGKIINVYQPAGKMEEFFREVGTFKQTSPIHNALGPDGFHQLFEAYGMNLLGPPLSMQ